MRDIALLYSEAVDLLSALISVPSFSREEDKTAALIVSFLEKRGVAVFRKGNNIWAFNKYYDKSKPTILLNSHHDTVRPNSAYTIEPFEPVREGGKLYGLGSNDAGASVVSLISVFLYYYESEGLVYNLCLAITAEEEVSGKNGIESILPELGVLDFAIVGEPTQMNMAIAEKGLVVLDCTVHGIAGHAARDEGDNAIYKAMKDIEWFRTYRFEKSSELLGEVKMNVTVIQAGTQHNVIPASCVFTVDVRVPDCYTNEEIVTIVKEHVACDVQPRSLRLKPSSIPKEHPIVQRGLYLGLQSFGSPTMSDQALLPFPSLKVGPGDSARSHSADEFIYLHEIKNGIWVYIQLLDGVLNEKSVKEEL